MMLFGFTPNMARKSNKRIAVSSITGRNFDPGVDRREEDRRDERKPAPTPDSLAYHFILARGPELRRQEPTERRNHWKNQVHSLRRNQRQHHQSTQTPPNQPNDFRRNFPPYSRFRT